MRLTKNWIKIDSSVRPRKRNIAKEPDPLNYSNRINDKGGLYLQKILKAKDGYQTINNKYDSNSIVNYNRNIQNIFSTDEKRQKATSYIMGSLIDKNKDKDKEMDIPRNNFSSNKDLYKNNYSSEFNMVDNPKTKSLLEINKKDMSINTTNINDEKDNKIKTPKKENGNLKNIKGNLYGNNNMQNSFLNFSKNNVKFNNSENETAFKKSESMSKKYDKIMTLTRRQDFFKKLNVINDEKKLRNENVNLNKENKLINNSQLAQTIPSPKRSTSIRQFSPFNDILSKSSNTFFINKIPVNNNDNSNMNNLSVKNAYNNKSSFQCKKIVDKENISMNKNKNDFDRTMKNNYSNKWLLNLDNHNEDNNNENTNNKIIYRNKQAINQKAFQSNSLRNDENRNKYRKKYLYISSRHRNDNENHRYKNKIVENDLKINEFSINEIYNDEKSKNIKINREDLKKYLNYFIKDIAPININQFVIYSHSNNNYKDEGSTLKSDETGKIISLKNKSSVELNRVQEERYLNRRSKNINNMNNSSSFIQELNHMRFKDNILDINNTSSLNKILVKKRPINENNMSNINDDIYKINKKIYDNYTGFTICQKIKGETITNIPLNINNLEIINEYLKESGFEITKIKTSKLMSKENTKMKKKNELTSKKEREDTKRKLNKDKDKDKERQNTNNEIKKLSNIKDRQKTFVSGFYEDISKRKNASLKPRNKLKKTPTKMSETSKQSNMKSKKNIKKIKDDSVRNSFIGKLNEKMDDSRYEKEKMNLREKLNRAEGDKNIIMCSPNFSFDNNYKK